ncbi:hypothetical protein D3C81_1937150 [compost metagenome]
MSKARLNRTFPVGCFTDQLRTRRFLQRSGQNLRCTGTPFISEYSYRIGLAPAFGQRPLTPFIFVLNQYDAFTFRNELLRHLDYNRQNSSWIVAHINNKTFHTLLF